VTEFVIAVVDSDDDITELHDLYAAILDDDELRTARKALVLGPVEADRMGVEEYVRLVLDNPALDTAVSTCVTAWLATRKSRRLKITVRADGSAEIEADGIRDVTPGDVRAALDAARLGRPDAATE
jgi:hypothetical protein